MKLLSLLLIGFIFLGCVSTPASSPSASATSSSSSQRQSELEQRRAERLQLREQYRQELIEKGLPLLISRFRIGDPNSAGGVLVQFIFENLSEKEIKYVYFEVTPYNRVNDIAPSQIGGKTLARCEAVGPIPQFEYKNGIWENVWYNPTITQAVINRIEIIYTDNTTVFIDGERAKQMITEREVI